MDKIWQRKSFEVGGGGDEKTE